MQGVQAVVDEISVTRARVLIASGWYRGKRIIDLDFTSMKVQGQQRPALRGQGMKGESKPRSKAAVPTNAAAAARPQVVRERYDQHRAHRPGLRDRAQREALIVDDHQEELYVDQEEHDMEQGSDCTEELDVDDMDWRPNELTMAAMFLEAEDGGPGSSMVRTPMTPNSPAEERMNELAERIHDLESGMRLAHRNIGALRSQQTALYPWVVWFGRIRHWMANCARTFPGGVNACCLV